MRSSGRENSTFQDLAVPATIYLTDLLLAMEWVSAATYPENRAYVSRETGRIFWDPEAAT